MANILFLKQAILEELESSEKGSISSDQILSLNNGLYYQLEAAVMILTELSQNIDGKKYEGKIITMKEVSEKGCDLYMETIIIDDFAFNVIEGFRATLIKKKRVKKPLKETREAKRLAKEKKRIKDMQETLKKEKELFEKQKKDRKERGIDLKDEITEVDYTKDEKDEVSDFILKF